MLGAVAGCSDDGPVWRSAKRGTITTIEERLSSLGPGTALRVGPDDAVYVGVQGEMLRYPKTGERHTIYHADESSNRITSIAFGRGLVFFIEGEDRTVRALKPNGGLVNFAGNGRAARPPDGAPAALSPLLCPSRLAYSTKSDELLIRDGVELRAIDAKGTIRTDVHQDKINDTESCTVFAFPGLATDPDGWIYHAGHNWVTKVRGPEHQTYPPEGFDASPPAFDGIVDFVYDRRSKSVFVADRYRVRRIAPDGTISLVAGNGEDKISGDGARASDAGLGELVGLDLDGKGNLYLLTEFPPTLRVIGGPIGNEGGK
ncbi:MAG TPA: hypothetical protein VG795_02200 [Acidimicrobiia bacterium]|nr:hypothetical protein [Acidimicrobiia bacterium]